jgi:HNH endonuclease
MKCFKCSSEKTYTHISGKESWVVKPEGVYCYSCWNRKIATGISHIGRKRRRDEFGHLINPVPFNKKTLLNLTYMGARGPDNPNWKGGITPINQKARGTKEYDEWRKRIFVRDDFSCQKCHKKGVRLHAHHIKSFAVFRELRFNTDNGITLCIPCHKLTDNFKRSATAVPIAIRCP